MYINKTTPNKATVRFGIKNNIMAIGKIILNI